MGKAVEMATEAMNLTADEITIVHYDDHVPCGQTRYRTSGLRHSAPPSDWLAFYSPYFFPLSHVVGMKQLT